MTTKNTARATTIAKAVNDATKDIYAGAKSGKFGNGTTLISGKIAKTKIAQIESHVESINDYAGFAVYHAAMHDNFDPLKRLFAAFIGVRGQLVGEGKTLKQFITKMTTGIDVTPEGIVSRRMAGREGQKQAVPVTFRVLVDNKKVAGDEQAGFIMTFMAWRKLVKDQTNAAKNRESIAGTKAGELVDGQPDGSEQAPAPSVDGKNGGPLPFASILADLEKIKGVIATNGNGYNKDDSRKAMAELAALVNQLQERDELEAQAETNGQTAETTAKKQAAAA